MRCVYERKKTNLYLFSSHQKQSTPFRESCIPSTLGRTSQQNEEEGRQHRGHCCFQCRPRDRQEADRDVAFRDPATHQHAHTVNTGHSPRAPQKAGTATPASQLFPCSDSFLHSRCRRREAGALISSCPPLWASLVGNFLDRWPRTKADSMPLGLSPTQIFSCQYPPTLSHGPAPMPPSHGQTK